MGTGIWWEIHAECVNVEDAGELLLAHGIPGLEIVSSSRIRFFVFGEVVGRTAILAALSESGLAITEVAPAETDWTSQCPELWEEVRIGSLVIVPMGENATHAAPFDGGRIAIRPGAGFGTGHHPTTKMLGEMIEALMPRLPPGHVIDVGTGSGLLALVCAAHAPRRVFGLDTDWWTLVNARENLALNPALARNVALFQGEISACVPAPGAALILANLYAEILCAIEPELRMRCMPGGALLVSGFTAADTPRIEAQFALAAWRKVGERRTRAESAAHGVGDQPRSVEWTALQFERRRA